MTHPGIPRYNSKYKLIPNAKKKEKNFFSCSLYKGHLGWYFKDIIEMPFSFLCEDIFKIRKEKKANEKMFRSISKRDYPYYRIG